MQKVDGAKGSVAQFDGKSYIEVPISKVLNPARSPMTVEVTLRASADGVILARGGQSLGFLIEIEDGKPVFAYRGPEGISRAVGSDSILGQWITLKATVDKDQLMQVFIDDKRVGQSKAKGLIPRNPNDGLQIGSDSGSPVDKKSPEGFRGEIQSVRIYQGSR
ncbi:MAG: laminin G domain-containing protein [Pirellula sp.]